MQRPVAVLDANVLYPAPLRDLLIRLAIAGLYQARWSEQILDECFDNLVEDRPDLTQDQLARTRRLMKTALPDAVVTGYEDRIAELDLPDPDDRHVLAAAMTAGASLLVTANLDDFPAARLPEGLRALSPGQFVLGLANDDLDVVVDVVDAQASGLVNPPMTMNQAGRGRVGRIDRADPRGDQLIAAAHTAPSITLPRGWHSHGILMPWHVFASARRWTSSFWQAHAVRGRS